jgi:hypothetical protein
MWTQSEGCSFGCEVLRDVLRPLTKCIGPGSTLRLHAGGSPQRVAQMMRAGRTIWCCGLWPLLETAVCFLGGRDRSAGPCRLGEDRGKRHVGIERALASLLVVGSVLAAPGFGWAAGMSGPVADETVNHSAAATAEVTFGTPNHFAIITELASRRQRLYRAGDVVLDANGVEWKILQIEREKLRISDPRSRRASWVAVGSFLPGSLKRLVTGTPELDKIEYRYVPTDGPLDAEPRVIELRGSRAALAIDVPPAVSGSPLATPESRGAMPPIGHSPESRQQPDMTLLGRVRVKETAKDSYEINAADFNAASEQGGKVLAEAWPKVLPKVSFRQGASLEVQSPVADGTLGPRGFQVTTPNLAERGGIEVGDVILAVNGQPINNFADLYRVYNQFQKDPNPSLIQLDLERGGRLVTKTYRIR